MRDKIVVTDIYWHNIYLNITLQGENLELYEFFISNLKGEQYPLEMKDGVCVINIVNLPETELLKNGKWYLLAEKAGKYV